VRLVVLDVNGEIPNGATTVLLQDWLSVSKRKALQGTQWHTIAVDVSAYQSQNILLIIDGAAAWRDDQVPAGGNGNGWMYIRQLSFTTETAADTMSDYFWDMEALVGTTYDADANTLTIESGTTSVTLPSLTFNNYRLAGIFTALNTSTEGSRTLNPTIDASGIDTDVITYNAGSRTITVVGSGTTTLKIGYQKLGTAETVYFDLVIAVVE
jgi:hypothetical protein